MASFDLEIVAPDGIKYRDQVEALKVKAEEGQLEVLAQHAPLIAMLQSGTIKAHKGSENFTIEASGGVLQVKNNRATVLIT